MLNTRNVMAAVIIVTVVSLIGACLSLFQSPESKGLGVDSYGTRTNGFRGLFEILEELHVPVERANAPPNRLTDQNRTLALLEPNLMIVSTEPAYLNAVGKWVRQGGSVVVTAPNKSWQALGLKMQTKDVLHELGLKGVYFRELDPALDSKPAADRKRDDDSDLDDSAEPTKAESKRIVRNFTRMFGRQSKLAASPVHATADGSLAQLFPHGLDLVVPDDALRVIESDNVPGSNVSQGRIRAVLEPKGDPETIAAVYAVGSGTITVLADPRLAHNELVGQGDNPVLVASLLVDAKRPIVFDEFYHGLTVRSNPLWLLSRFPYGILAASVLATTLLVGWRAARFLGPPLASRPVSRRTLSEYIEAMSRLLDRSRQPVPFLLREIRHGLLWRIRHDLGLPPGQDDAEKLIRTLQRRDPELAANVRDAIRAIDNSLAHPNQPAQKLEQTFAKASISVPRHAV
jgi:hypothetical protein